MLPAENEEVAWLCCAHLEEISWSRFVVVKLFVPLHARGIQPSSGWVFPPSFKTVQIMPNVSYGSGSVRPFFALLLFIFPRLTAGSPAVERADLVVAVDGSGQFRTIQAAINSIPATNAKNVVILIKKWTYQEKLFITTSHLTLVGEDRDSTRIVYAELRTNWTKAADNRADSLSKDVDWGSAVVNIGNGVTDIVLANLTVHNNYGTLHGNHEHQFAIRGFRATRVMILYCTIIADGGDTLSLWDNESGMYYHSNCYFEGWVDYVCPRGWCYITDSQFYGHNLSASIWHDGSKNKDQKFVIRYSSFDGVPGFPLGRHHRDGQIYLLDCVFSKNMADIPIYLPESPNAVVWQWGFRHYFYNDHREGGDYRWHADNLSRAEGAPTHAEVNAAWTFGGKWDPESTMPAVLPYVSHPSPRNGAYDTPQQDLVLGWVPSRNGESEQIFFWKTDFPEAYEHGVRLRTNQSATGQPVFVSRQSGNRFHPGPLSPNSTYYWRIDEVVGTDTLRGPLWHFTTAMSGGKGTK